MVPELLIGLAVLVILILIALKMAFTNEEPNDDVERERLIHVSGIYSIVRASPREDLAALRPKDCDVQRYLTTVKEDIYGVPLSELDKAELLANWKVRMEANLRAIENGDKQGGSFYYYDYPDGVCPVCGSTIAKGNFVTREEIHNFTQIIPPFHLGCTCMLYACNGNMNLRETTLAGLTPLFDGDTPPPLAEWTTVVSPSSVTARKMNI